MSPCRWITNPSTLWVIGNVLRKYRRGLRQGSPLPPGGDVAVERDARPRRAHWLGYRPEPRELGDARPAATDLSPDGMCWWWAPDDERWQLDRPCDWQFRSDLCDLWLPYSAIADPSAEPEVQP